MVLNDFIIYVCLCYFMFKKYINLLDNLFKDLHLDNTTFS